MRYLLGVRRLLAILVLAIGLCQIALPALAAVSAGCCASDDAAHDDTECEDECPDCLCCARGMDPVVAVPSRDVREARTEPVIAAIHSFDEPDEILHVPISCA